MTVRTEVAGLALAVLLGCERAPDLEAARLFERAAETFREAQSAEDHARAAALYQQILDRGLDSGAVHYNLGNALYRAGRPAEAIAAWRQAQRLRPADPYLLANLETALGRPAGPGPGSGRPDLVDHVLFWRPWLPGRRQAQVLCALITVALAALLASAVRPRWRRGLRPLTAAACFVVVLLAASLAVELHEGLERYGVVRQDEVVARKGNSLDYEPAFTEPLRQGTEFVIEEERGDWLRLDLGGGLEGWIPRDAAVTW